MRPGGLRRPRGSGNMRVLCFQAVGLLMLCISPSAFGFNHLSLPRTASFSSPAAALAQQRVGHPTLGTNSLADQPLNPLASQFHIPGAHLSTPGVRLQAASTPTHPSQPQSSHSEPISTPPIHSSPWAQARFEDWGGEKGAEVLNEWLTSYHGWDHNLHSKVDIGQTVDKGLGGLSRGLIRRGQRICQVPMNAVLLADANHYIEGQPDVLTHLLGLTIPGGGEISTLSMKLGIYKLIPSVHDPMLKSWPSDMRTHVLFWTEAELELLKGTGAYELAISIRQDVAGAVEKITDLLMPEFAAAGVSMTLEEVEFAMTWAFAVVFAYAAVLQERDTVAMVPYVVYLNHHPTTTIRFQDDGESVYCVADGDYSPGDEVCLNYGHKTNSELITSYGFFIPDNPHASLEMNLQVDEADPLLQRKLAILAEFGLGRQTAFQVSSSAEPDYKFLAALRVMALDTHEQVEREEGHFPCATKALRLKSSLDSGAKDLQVEAKAFSLLASCCEAAQGALASDADLMSLRAEFPERRAVLDLISGFLAEERRDLQNIQTLATSKALDLTLV